jgi:hypothetical protein
MKIVDVKRVVETNYYIEIEDVEPITHYVSFRRSEGGSWEILMGESWEPCYTTEERLEKEFQNWLITQKNT